MRHPSIRVPVAARHLVLLSAIVLTFAACTSTPIPNQPQPYLGPSYTPWPTSTITSTPAHLARVAELLKTPQPTPLPKPLANETGLVPGQTTQEQALAREGWLPGEVREHGWVYRYFLNQYRTAFFNGVVVQVEMVDRVSTADQVAAQYGMPELVVWLRAPEQLVYPSRGLAFSTTCIPSAYSCLEDLRGLQVMEQHYFVPTTLQEWVAREQPYWPDGYYIQGWGR